MAIPYPRNIRTVDHYGISVYGDGPQAEPGSRNMGFYNPSILRSDYAYLFDSLFGEIMIIEWLDSPTNEKQTAEYIASSEVIKVRSDYTIYEKKDEEDILIFAVREGKAFMATYVLPDQDGSATTYNAFIKNNPLYDCYTDILIHLIYCWGQINRGLFKTPRGSIFWQIGEDDQDMYHGFNVCESKIFKGYANGYKMLRTNLFV